MSSELQEATSDIPKPGNTAEITQLAVAGTWTFIAAALAGLGTVGGLLLHLLGHVGHQSYIHEWGLDPGLFPKPVDEIIVLGYIAIMDRSVSILSVLQEYWREIAAMWLAITLYVYLFLRVEKVVKRDKKAAAILSKVPDHIADLSKSALGTVLMLSVIPVGLYLIALVTVIPLALGESYGRSAAKNEFNQYTKGCVSTTSGSHCIEVFKAGKRVAYGFLIDSSPSYIALFDVEYQRARAIVRDGTELIAEERLNLQGEQKQAACRGQVSWATDQPRGQINSAKN